MAKNLFNSVRLKKEPKNVFDLSHDVKLSCNMGELIPFALIDCVPGDKFTLGCEAMVRFAPLVSPVMHLFNVFMHWFFVPKRIIWNLYEKWITSGTDTVNRPVFPFVEVDAANHGAPGDLLDYLGVPPELIGTQPSQNISALPLAAYQTIYNEYYRDQNLVTSLYEQGDTILEDLEGDQTALAKLFPLRKRAWEHDYFTSCLPFAQKGTAVSLPLGSVELDPASIGVSPLIRDAGTHGLFGGSDLGSNLGSELSDIPVTNTATFDPNGTLIVGATLINDLRRAYALQRFLERNALGGTRFIEFNRAHYGVFSSDKRLQRPEYITGTKSPIVISEVLNTTGSFDATTPDDPTSPPQGNMAGHGVGITSGKYASYFCEEQGYIMGIMSILPRSAYMQGIERLWFKTEDPTQEYFPEFANIGEQEVLNQELYAYLPSGTDVDEAQGTFGYVPRYAEYKFITSRVAGEFRTSLRHWHDARNFTNQPLLNQDFIEVIESYSELNRIFAVEDTDVDKLYVQVYNRVKAVRPMPKYGTPI